MISAELDTWVRDRRELQTSLLRELVRIPSVNPPGDERAVADRLCSAAHRLGLRPELREAVPGRPNLLLDVDFDAPGPTLLLTSHTDVVPADPAQFDGRLEDGRVYGRGSADAKSSLVAMLLACAYARERAHRLRGRLRFAAVVGEECDGCGTLALLRHGVRADEVVVGEPTGLDVAVGHRGSFWRTVAFRGRAAHASDPDAGVSAIHHAARFVLRVRDHDRRLRDRPCSDALFGAPRMSANQIAGGVLPNVIPERCVVEIDRRLVPGETFPDAESELVEMLRTLAAEDAETDTVLEGEARGVEPAAIAPDSSLALAAQRAVRAAGYPGHIVGFPAGTDLGHFAKYGMRGLVLGPGHLRDAHTAAESVDVGEVEAAAVAYGHVVELRLGREVHP